MKKKLAVLTAAALLSVAAASIGGASAYFTTNVQASGRQTVSLGDQTTIEENFGSWAKHVRIRNESTSSQAVFVRAHAFAGDDYPLTISGTGWEPEGEWYVFRQPVEPGRYTELLDVAIGGKVRDESAEAAPFNVVIVYETTPAVQDGTDRNGAVQYETYSPDVWNRTVEKGEQNA